MRLMKNVMHSAVRCLVIVFSILISIPTIAQDEGYIVGYGAIKDSRGRLDIGKSIDAAREDLYKKILEISTQQVSTHTVLKNSNGKQDYKSITAVDSGIRVREEDIEYILWEGFWVARIKRSKVFPQEVKWVEQNITINNTYKEPTTYSGGFRRDVTVTNTRRRTDVIGPSGRVVKSEPRGGEVKKVRNNWNGCYGYTWESTKKIH